MTSQIMVFRRVLLLAIGWLLLSSPIYSQNLSGEQNALNNQILAFLKEEGLRPEHNGDGLIAFVYDECRFLIHIDPEEKSPMFVTLAAIFELPKDLSPKIVALAANELNNINGIKVLGYDDSFSVQAEMYVHNARSFLDVFYSLVRQIQVALSSFAEACTNVNSNGSASPPKTNNSGESTKPTPKTTGSVSSTKNKTEGVYYGPKVNGQLASSARIKKVTITDEYTCIELSSNSTYGGTTAEWCNIDGNTYIINEDKPFEKIKLVQASGIKLAPGKTYYGGPNKTISFKLYFPPIPKDTKSISLIEPDSSWCFYGITLHK